MPNEVKKKKPVLSSHKYKKGDIVVFKDITWESGGHGGFYADHLLEVTKVHRGNNYLEIRETMCAHSNRRVWGSDGADIRHATYEERKARSRLPKTISRTCENPKAEVVFYQGRNDVLRIEHYTSGNSLLLVDSKGSQFVVEIFDIREAVRQERDSGFRLEEADC